MFVVEWYCFAVDRWIRYMNLILPTQAEAERIQGEMTRDYNPKKMIGVNPDNVRIMEV